MPVRVRLVIALVFAFSLPLCHAAGELVFPATTNNININAHDGTELSIHQYPAKGRYLAIWIASGYGLSERDIQIAEGLAQHGVEVWQIDFAESLFEVNGSNFMRRLNPDYVVDLINTAQQRTHKGIVLVSHSYGAIPALRGATLWQQAPQHQGRLDGIVLFSPDLYATIPELGLAPDYLPITHATNLPIMIYQAGKRGNAAQFPRLLAQLSKSNDAVFFKLLTTVTSPMYPGDTSTATHDFLQRLPQRLTGVIHMLATLPTPTSTPLYAFHPDQVSFLDTHLKPYRAHPRPLAIKLRSANNRNYDIKNYKGKVSVINFWATWCHPCRKEIPSLNRLRNHMRGKPFRLISINYAESAKTIRAFLKQVKVDYPVLLDSTGKESSKWNVIVYPSTFVIGSDGKIHYGVNAALNWDSPHVIHLLDSLMPTKTKMGEINKSSVLARR